MRLRATKLSCIGNGGSQTYVFGGTAVAGSVRIPINSTYSGPVIRVRESAGNTEQDIFAGSADANGNRFIDTTALLAFTGANSGFITTYYDQSGNGRNLVQTTAANQARIVLSGVVDTLNSVPAPRYLGNGTTGNGYTVAFTLSQPVTIIIVYRYVSFISQAHLTDGTSFSNRLLVGLNSATQRILYAGSIANTTPAETLNTSNTWASVFNGAASFTSINGTASATLNPGAQSTVGQVVGGGQATLGGFNPATSINGYIQEYLVYPSALTTAQIQTIAQNQGTAYGITVI